MFIVVVISVFLSEIVVFWKSENILAGIKISAQTQARSLQYQVASLDSVAVALNNNLTPLI